MRRKGFDESYSKRVLYFFCLEDRPDILHAGHKKFLPKWFIRKTGVALSVNSLHKAQQRFDTA